MKNHPRKHEALGIGRKLSLRRSEDVRDNFEMFFTSAEVEQNKENYENFREILSVGKYLRAAFILTF